MNDKKEQLASVIYGPVPSWRLGRSLGVDMVSESKKHCSFDCVYCQLGPTCSLTMQRREFVPISRLTRELQKLPQLALDYITFSGTAEPTLAVNLGDAIATVKEQLSTPVAVLTNSSLMPDAQVRKELALADVVVAKLDAPTEKLLQRVNRPAPGLALAQIVSALRTFRKEYGGRLALQLMFFKSNEGCAEGLAALARTIAPDEVQLNTPLRPCAVRPLSPDVMNLIRQAFTGLEVVTVYEARRPEVIPLDRQETVARRPESERKGPVLSA